MKKKIFIGNIPYSLNEMDLLEIFSFYGCVKKIEKHSRGFAFIEMVDENDGAIAIEQLHRSIIGGRKVSVNWAYDNKNRTIEDKYMIRPLTNSQKLTFS